MKVTHPDLLISNSGVTRKYPSMAAAIAICMNICLANPNNLDRYVFTFYHYLSCCSNSAVIQ